MLPASWLTSRSVRPATGAAGVHRAAGPGTHASSLRPTAFHTKLEPSRLRGKTTGERVADDDPSRLDTHILTIEPTSGQKRILLARRHNCDFQLQLLTGRPAACGWTFATRTRRLLRRIELRLCSPFDSAIRAVCSIAPPLDSIRFSGFDLARRRPSNSGRAPSGSARPLSAGPDGVRVRFRAHDQRAFLHRLWPD